MKPATRSASVCFLLDSANGRILFQGGPARIRENRIFDDRFEF